jgi:hypothetical protein
MESALVVAEIMAREMQKDGNWIQTEMNSFSAIAKNYLPASY